MNNNCFHHVQGTNVDEAKVMIGSSGLKILPVDNLDEAARYRLLSEHRGSTINSDLFQTVLQAFKDCRNLQRCSS